MNPLAHSRRSTSLSRSFTSSGLLSLAGWFGLALTAPAAQAQVVVGEATYGGTGCPNGTAEIAVSPDGLQLQVRYTAFEVQTGVRSLDRKACALAIPLQVRPGLRLVVHSPRHSGVVELPAGASAQLSTETFEAGSVGQKKTFSYTGPVASRYTTMIEEPETVEMVSECGGALLLRSQASVLVQSSATGAAPRAMMSVSSSSAQPAVAFDLSYRNCGNTPLPLPTPEPTPAPTPSLPVPPAPPAPPAPVVVTPAPVDAPRPPKPLMLALDHELRGRQEVNLVELLRERGVSLSDLTGKTLKSATLIAKSARRGRVSVVEIGVTDSESSGERGREDENLVSQTMLKNETVKIALPVLSGVNERSLGLSESLVLRTRGRVQLLALRLELN